MKKLMRSLVIVAGFSFVATAVAGSFGQYGGRHHGHEKSVEIRLMKLNRLVALTDEQEAALKSLYENRTIAQCKMGRQGLIYTLDTTAGDYQQTLALRANKAADCVREKVMRQGALHAEVQAILTKAQRTKLNEFHQAKLEKRNARQERSQSY